MTIVKSAERRTRGDTLWSRAFGTYWSATSLSNLGSGVTLVALPILAAQELHAGARQLGLLRAAETVPYVVLGLLAGQLADRLRPLRIMIFADVVRALLLGLIVVLTLGSSLTLGELYVAVFAVGSLTVCYDVAQFTLLPSIVARRQMIPANSSIELARGAAATFGPGLGGVLVAALRAGPALLVDAVSYVYSAAALFTLRRMQPPSTERPRTGSAVGSLTRGLAFVGRHPLLRPMTAYLGVNNLCNQAFLTGLIAYVEVDQHRSSFQVGLAFGAYGAGFLLAAVLAPALSRRLGAGISVTASSLLSALGIALLAVSTAGSPTGPGSLAVIVAGSALTGFAAPIFNVQSVALRLTVTPKDLLGRVNAVVKLVSQGALPLGALAGGALFAAFPPRTAFVVVATVSFLATAILVLSPVTRSRELGPGTAIPR
ncbi:MFS transporter [Actinoallomurus acanthiterrae]